MTGPLRPHENGVLLDIRLTPNAASDRIEGIFIDGEKRERLKVKVTAISEKGKANKALLKLLCKSMRQPTSGCDILIGKLDRNKTILIKGNTSVLKQNMKGWIKTI